MTDASLKNQIAAALRDYGFAVTLLEEKSDAKTPDFLATRSGQRYLIELKTKEDDPAARARERAMLAAGEISTKTEYWGPKNTIARIVRDGARQLRAFPAEQRDFCLLWLHAEGTDKQSQWQQFFATVYGTTNIFDLQDRQFRAECYYFYDSAFYRWSDTLDGVVATHGDQLALWINSYSPRVAALRRSSIVQAFEGGVVDPLALEQAGTALIANCDADRRDANAVIQYLQTKYGRTMLNNIDVGRLTVMLEVPLEDDDEASL